MLRTLLTPLRARFDLTPRPESAAPSPVVPEEDEELAPEDFARDVLFELMRNSVENLREADGTRAKVQILSEIQKFMLQDGRTKDVFREMDGFIILMSVLSGLRESSGGMMIVEPEEQVHEETVEATRLVFMITSEAMLSHAENAVYFKKEVGYQSLALAINPLVCDKTTVDETMGYLLALALQDFTVASVFTALRGVPIEAVDAKLLEYEPRLGTIRYPDAISIFWTMVPELIEDDNDMRYSVFKLSELLSQLSHRNQSILSSIGILDRLVSSYHDMKGKAAAGGSGLSKKEKSVMQKLLRKLLEMGATTAEARSIFQRAVKEDETLDADILDVIKYGMKSRWLEHISMESPAALTLSEDGIKGLPYTGFTFMTWVWISEMPHASHTLFRVRVPSKELVTLSVTPDGSLELVTFGCPAKTVLEKAKLNKFRWTHITLVHHPHRITNPTIRIFIDGVLLETLHWTYPKPDYSTQTITYTIGDASSAAQMSWCIASAHLTATPLGDDLPRLIHHLGPRYYGNFQDPKLVNYLTYEASTSLNMFITTVAAKLPNATEIASIMKAVRDGLGIAENSIVFAFSPFNAPQSGDVATLPSNGHNAHSKEFKVEGDVYVVKAACLDTALWKIGGAAVTLRLVQLANTPHDLSRTLSILTDGLRNSWQNSEDMERLRGYEVLGDILRTKAQLVNMTGFETVFEFLGLNFRTPEQSTIVNVVGYKAIALDLELWSRTKKEIQRVYLEHFTTLLVTSRYKKFNSYQRIAKMGLVRKLLFALQAEWYPHDMAPFLIEALKAATHAHFSKDDAIKPIVSHIAATLHQESDGSDTPRSVVSRTENKDTQQRAEQILEVLVSTISAQPFFDQFCAALPLTRICLLLLGERPTSVTATQVLILIGMSTQMSSAFSRKFELITGWSVLKTVLPFCWDPSVNEAAIDILLGRTHFAPRSAEDQQTGELCSQMVPVILSALQHGLGNVAANSQVQSSDTVSNASDTSSHFSSMNESTMEVLVEELMDLHASNANFRDIFKSHSTTQIFVEAYRGFVEKVSILPEITQRIVRILEKLGHFGLALALGNEVAGSQKREILDTLQKAEAVLNPTASKMAIDPRLVADNRSVRQRITSARFSMQVGERTIMKTVTRMSEWRKSIQESEKKRFRKNFLDLQETRRQVSRLYEWTQLLISERGVWPRPEKKMWRLDETEGPHRIRKKLEPENCKSPSSRVDGTGQQIRDVQAPDASAAAALQTEVPPWAEAYEISATETDADRQLAEEITDDKHRRIRHELEPADVIEAVTTVARVVGVDSSPGLLIIGRSHLYMLDGLVESEDGEVVDVHDAPKRLSFVPGSMVELDGPQRAQRWSHEQIASFSDKTFLFRDVALEIFFKDSRSLLIVFLDKTKRLSVNQRLTNIIAKYATEPAPTQSFVKTARFGKASANKSTTSMKANDLSTAQRKWQAREISNFTYLSILNQISGRTPSDATQYPVFPWVIKDYTSQTLDLTSPDTYRDLSRPMGAMNDGRRDAAEQRYTNLESVGEEPFHYGTHFSSSMIVCHFLIRLSPFTNMFKTLQGGDWDLPDRLFSDLARAYDSAAVDVRGDVRELIPEFFTCPEFLENSANLDFGVLQHTGERIHDVKLPPWARQDPMLFITQNRRALESDYVSEHLPAWIDLIWGCKQRDPDSLNCFHPLSYEGSIDLDSITDELEREATIGIIHNFGQTPRKLFTTSHPQRFNHGLSTLPIGTLHGIEEDPHLLIQDSRPLKDLGAGVAIRELALDAVSERLIPCAEGALCVPSAPHEQIEWHMGGAELKVLVDRKVVQVVENAYCNCASFADAQSLVTGSSDYTVRLWKVTRNTTGSAYNSMRIHLSHIMRIHTDEVLCVAASRTWSLVISGSKDGSAAIWDLNRGVYVRSIWHGSSKDPDPVNLVAINESTGYIATCSKLKLCLHTINARPLATLDLTTTPSYSSVVPTITAMAFHEREYSHLGVLATGGPDGSITLRTWTADGTPEDEKAQWEFLTIRSMRVRTTEHGITRPPSVTALKFLGESLCHGEETGKVYYWRLPE